MCRRQGQSWRYVVTVLMMGALAQRAAGQCNQWQPVESPWDYVYAITSFQGQLIASGSPYGPPEPIPHTARWDGTSWEPIDAGLQGGARSFITHDGQLHAAANLLIDGKALPSVVRWDGAHWHALGNWPASYVNDLVTFDGSLVASGSGVWQWDGVNWIQLGNLNTGGALTVYNGQLIVAALGDAPHTSCVYRFDGQDWEQFGCFETPFDNLPSVEVLGVYRNELIVGGFFSSVNGEPANCIARWDGSTWHNLGSGVDYLVFTLMIYHDDLFVGGAFSFAGGAPSDAIARWNGSAWAPIGYSTGGVVFDLTLHDNQVLAGGLLHATQGIMHGIDRWRDCCVGDVNFDWRVDVADLLAVINHWGPCPPGARVCPADITGDGQIDVNDLLFLLGAWGACP